MPRINLNQKRVFVDEVFKNFYVLFGTFQSSRGNKFKTKKWNEVAKIVNKIGPAKKSGKQWKKYFSTIKSQTKDKIAQTRRKLNQGLASQVNLNDIDDKIIRMYGTNILDGLKSVGECGMPNNKIEPFLESFPEHSTAILQLKKKKLKDQKRISK